MRSKHLVVDRTHQTKLLDDVLSRINLLVKSESILHFSLLTWLKHVVDFDFLASGKVNQLRFAGPNSVASILHADYYVRLAALMQLNKYSRIGGNHCHRVFKQFLDKVLTKVKFWLV